MTHQTWPDAPASLIALWEARRAPLDGGAVLPPADCDLARLSETRLPPLPPDAPARPRRKTLALDREFAGKPALFALHGLTIAHLRKRSFPAQAPALFRRMWTETAAPLLDGLSNRWLISAAATFADHGETEGERRLGAEVVLLFGLLKLYEFERLFAGVMPDEPHPLRRRRTTELPLGLEGFSLLSGGLDVNLLAPIWQRAQVEPVAGPVALRLLERMNGEAGTVFARLAAMRTAKIEAKRLRRGET